MRVVLGSSNATLDCESVEALMVEIGKVLDNGGITATRAQCQHVSFERIGDSVVMKLELHVTVNRSEMNKPVNLAELQRGFRLD